jgi:hypothetical protein
VTKIRFFIVSFTHSLVLVVVLGVEEADSVPRLSDSLLKFLIVG